MLLGLAVEAAAAQSAAPEATGVYDAALLMVPPASPVERKEQIARPGTQPAVVAPHTVTAEQPDWAAPLMLNATVPRGVVEPTLGLTIAVI